MRYSAMIKITAINKYRHKLSENTEKINVDLIKISHHIFG